MKVSPPAVNIILNNSNTILVEILLQNNQHDFNGFAIQVSYDPAVIHLDSWELGDLVSSFDVKLVEKFNNPPGIFHLEYTKIGSGVTGDGVLLGLTFSGVNPSTTDLTITSAYLAQSGTAHKIYPSLEHGFLTVGYYTAPVTGAVSLQGQARRSGVPVSLGTGTFYMQGPFDALSLPVLGVNLDFGAVVSGDTYTLTTNQPRYLNLVRTLTVNDPLTLPPLRLLAGDVVGDNTIATADLDAVRAAFGAIGPGLAADLNADGVVDLRDLALVGGNFGLSSLEAYADWLP